MAEWIVIVVQPEFPMPLKRICTRIDQALSFRGKVMDNYQAAKNHDQYSKASDSKQVVKIAINDTWQCPDDKIAYLRGWLESKLFKIKLLSIVKLSEYTQGEERNVRRNASLPGVSISNV